MVARSDAKGGPQMGTESTVAGGCQPRDAYTARSFAARCLAFAYDCVHGPWATGSDVLLQMKPRNGVTIHTTYVRGACLLRGHGTEWEGH